MYTYFSAPYPDGSGELPRRHQINTGVIFKVTPHVGLVGGIIYDLAKSNTLSYKAGVWYEDDCFVGSIAYVHSFFKGGGIQPSGGVMVTFWLKNLGTYKLGSSPQTLTHLV